MIFEGVGIKWGCASRGDLRYCPANKFSQSSLRLPERPIEKSVYSSQEYGTGQHTYNHDCIQEIIAEFF